jgi:hypothetical protein
MNTKQQFLHFLKFHIAASPWIWFIPIILTFQPAISVLTGSSNDSLALSSTSALAFMCMIPMLFAAFVFKPEVLADMNYTSPQTQTMARAYSMDFILTRPVDRPVFFASRFALYTMVILIPLIFVIGVSYLRPSLSVRIPEKNTEIIEFYKARLPDAQVVPVSKTLVSVESPHGRVGFVTVMALTAMAASAIWPVFLCSIARLRWRYWIYWSVFVTGMIAIPLSLLINRRMLEAMLLFLQSHMVLSALVVVMLLFASWKITSRSLEKFEYP